MTTLFRTLMLVATLSIGATVAGAAFAQSGVQQACQAGQITPHGVFDCR